jgi:hypothetical protein
LPFEAAKEDKAKVSWLSQLRNRVAVRPTQPETDLCVPGAGPDFLCIGAQKAGTTWLYQQLASHPDFWMPPRKELHYFNERGHAPATTTLRNQDERDVRFFEKLQRLGTQPWLDLKNYAQLFAAKGSLLSGDITPAYSMLQDEIIALIVRYFPKLKVIFLARDPVERAWSQLSLAVRSGGVPAFDVTNPEEVIRQLLRPLAVLRSSPSMVVARWRRQVAADQLRVFFFDELQRNPAELRQSVIAFLGGDPAKPSGQLRPEYNSSAAKKKLPLSAEVRATLAEFFADEMRACAAELGGPATTWAARYGPCRSRRVR